MAAPNPPSQINSAGGNGNPFSALGMVTASPPERSRPYPWPLPQSAYQGAVGGAGGNGIVQVSSTPFYQPYQPYWPYQAPRLNGLPNPVVKA